MTGLKPKAPKKHHGKELNKPKKPKGFQKGEPCPNPGGRPKGHKELMAYCREFTFEAVEVLISIMRDDVEDAKTRLKAADMLIDRGWGRAPQALYVKLEGDDEPTTTVTPTRHRIIDALRNQFISDQERGEIIDITPTTPE